MKLMMVKCFENIHNAKGVVSTFKKFIVEEEKVCINSCSSSFISVTPELSNIENSIVLNRKGKFFSGHGSQNQSSKLKKIGIYQE